VSVGERFGRVAAANGVEPFERCAFATRASRTATSSPTQRAIGGVSGFGDYRAAFREHVFTPKRAYIGQVLVAAVPSMMIATKPNTGERSAGAVNCPARIVREMRPAMAPMMVRTDRSVAPTLISIVACWRMRT
jgi:hypothetical protein